MYKLRSLDVRVTSAGKFPGAAQKAAPNLLQQPSSYAEAWDVNTPPAEHVAAALVWAAGQPLGQTTAPTSAPATSPATPLQQQACAVSVLMLHISTPITPCVLLRLLCGPQRCCSCLCPRPGSAACGRWCSPRWALQAPQASSSCWVQGIRRS